MPPLATSTATVAPHVRNLVRVLDAVGTGLVVVESDGTIAFANPHASAVLGRSLHSLAGAAIADVFAPLAELVASCEDDRCERVVTGGAGRAITVGYQLSEIPPDPTRDDAALYAVVFQDITRWAELRSERDRLLQLATVGQVLPTVLHELKNPMASIATTVEVMIEELPAGELQDQLHAVLWEIRRMRLSFDGIGSVGRSLRSQWSEAIDHACREAVTVLQARADKAGVDIELDIADMPLLAFDASVVRAIVYNLVVNAIHACVDVDGDGDGEPGVVHVRAALDAAGTAFELDVADTGAGMGADTLARCRQLFFTTKARGSGIGLALCHRAVAEAGGGLAVDSELGAGTTVRVRIPVLPQSNPA